MNLLFHDISNASGFQGKNAEKYKIDSLKFFKIIEILKQNPPENRPRLTFDDGGESINIDLVKRLYQNFEIIIFIPTDYISKRGFLGEKEIKEINDLGVKIGSHSHYHRNMKFLDQASFINDWIKSKTFLEGLLGSKITSCSIPYGKYSKWQIKELYSLGFKDIYTSDVNSINIDNNIYTAGRLPIDSRFLWIEVYFLKFFGLKYISLRFKIVNYIKIIIKSIAI